MSRAPARQWASSLALAAAVALSGCVSTVETPSSPTEEVSRSVAPSSANTPEPLVDAPMAAPDCPPAPGNVPNGPNEQMVVAQHGTEQRPEVSMVRYPRPDAEGNPWTHWGQGLVLTDGRYVSAIGNHLGAEGNSYLFVFDPSTGDLTRFADIAEVIGGDPSWGYGKVHGQIVAGGCNEAFISTFWGTRNGLEYTDSYRGDELLRLDTATLEVEALGPLAPERGVPSLASAPEHDLVFAEAVDPLPRTDLGRDQGDFVVFDAKARDVVFRSDATEHIGFRNIMVGPDGTAYLAAEEGRLLTYSPGATELGEHPSTLPGGGWLRASSVPTQSGEVFGVTRDPERFFKLDTSGEISDLGPAQAYTTSMAVEPDGSRFYYVPGAHGESAQLGTPVVAVDASTGEHAEIARLGDLAADTLGLFPSGAYSVALDAVHRRLFVTLNAGTSPDERWGEVLLAVVDLPSDGRDLAKQDAATASSCPSGGAGARQIYSAIPPPPPEGGEAGIAFTDATADWQAEQPLIGVRGHAIAAADVNADGWTDVFVGTFADRPTEDYQQRDAPGPSPDQLLLGGPGGFTTDTSFPAEYGRTSGAAFADLDNDGDLDLVVSRSVREGERASAPSRVLRNDRGSFAQATVLDEPVGARSVGVLDYDEDGLLDLFITEDRFAGGSSVLLRNEGDLAFVDVTRDAGIGSGVHGLGVGTGDLNGDGAPDLLVGGSNRLFVSNGPGLFAEQPDAIPSWPVYGDEDDPAGVAVGDVNGDGRVDVVIGQHYNSTLDADKRVPVRLYLNETADTGQVRLRDVTESAGLIGLPTKSPHVEIADVDSDGMPDIVTTAAGQGGQPIVFRQVDRREGTPLFEPSSPPGPSQYWVTGVTVDADHDGRLDIVSVEWDPGLPTRFLRNTGQTGSWLAVSAAPGSAVDVFRPGEAGSGTPLATGAVGASTGYAAGPSGQAWFGLGPTETVDVVVTSPGEGPIALRSVATNQSIAMCQP